MLKVRVEQGSTVWEEEIETTEDFLSAISANPYNEKANKYTVLDDEDNIIVENIYFFEEDEDDDDIIYTSSELNEENGVNDDMEKISQFLEM